MDRMPSDITKKTAASKADKRAEALRANLQRRKKSEAVQIARGDKNAKPKNRE